MGTKICIHPNISRIRRRRFLRTVMTLSIWYVTLASSCFKWWFWFNYRTWKTCICSHGSTVVGLPVTSVAPQFWLVSRSQMTNMLRVAKCVSFPLFLILTKAMSGIVTVCNCDQFLLLSRKRRAWSSPQPIPKLQTENFLTRQEF